MFTHITIGTNDLDRARHFYDGLLRPLGLARAFDLPDRSGWGGAAPFLIVTTPIDNKPATGANGGTIGISAPSRTAVRQFHAAALANGGSCEGPPGPRDFAENAYAAYVRDPDGNKLGAFCYEPSSVA